MASESDLRELSSLFERFVRQRETSVFLPLLIGLTAVAERGNSNQENPDQERQQSATPTERVILINPITQSMVVIGGGAAGNFESLMRDLGAKNGPPPASVASMEAMPSVVIGDGDVCGECAICLEEWESGGVAREMPCKHKFHGNCIEKWLGMHGSCPVCRYKMPVEEEGSGKKTEEDESREGEGEGEERESRAIWFRFSFSGRGRGRSDGDANQASSNDSSDVSS